MRSTLPIAVLVLVLACASSRTAEVGPVDPEAIGGTWTFTFADPERLGGTIVIPSDTSPAASTLMSSDLWPGMIEYRGVLNVLMHTGRYVCWTHSIQQQAGIELTVYKGELHATYFDDCRRSIQGTARSQQRSVWDCKHTLLTLRRVAEP